MRHSMCDMTLAGYGNLSRIIGLQPGQKFFLTNQMLRPVRKAGLVYYICRSCEGVNYCFYLFSWFHCRFSGK